MMIILIIVQATAGTTSCDMTEYLKANYLCLNEAIDVAQNRPLCRLNICVWHSALSLVHARNDDDDSVFIPGRVFLFLGIRELQFSFPGARE